ncbi:RNB-like protein [Schizosaccharomyces japonicus yFS275]|uniref:RNB-like protein n=1 Tax=Schizosaccharomyces japonicus (strain yFS275 / FY16936) TaxID=402676 RepID=B6JYZ9_SCHJY|nr:RNB-like protein [Schizosaccharomyces japonicus yFS275]EEB06767.2 RNB-like protein [Schizosaccharomyces japonicus yFS275]
MLYHRSRCPKPCPSPTTKAASCAMDEEPAQAPSSRIPSHFPNKQPSIPSLKPLTNLQSSSTSSGGSSMKTWLPPIDANSSSWLSLQQHQQTLRHSGLLPAVESSFVNGHRRSASTGIALPPSKHASSHSLSGIGNISAASPSLQVPSYKSYFENGPFMPSNGSTANSPSSYVGAVSSSSGMVLSHPPSISSGSPQQGSAPNVPMNYSGASNGRNSLSFSNSPSVGVSRHAKSHSIASLPNPSGSPMYPPSLVRNQRGSRNFDAPWRPPNSQSGVFTPPASAFRPPHAGHRHRCSTGSLIVPKRPATSSATSPANSRKNLFTPYLPQSSVPALIAEHRLVTGVLTVSKKNRSDAFVSVDGLDADVFICGSKDRNRALEGDVVAVELLDVNEVWAGKLEKEENRRRKDGLASANDGSMNSPYSPKAQSVPHRSAIKAKDDEQVEGQTLFLLDQKQLGIDEKPYHAGHIVAVLQRAPGQVFSGVLGILRPSSAATKERQVSNGNAAQSSANERPKIVWFKPSDKRVPLIAIPTEQAPDDFIERDHEYSQQLFLASIKRWPVTSLHPFGMLVGQLGPMGSLKAQVEALLRDMGVNCDPIENSTSAAAAIATAKELNPSIAERCDEDIFLLTVDDAFVEPESKSEASKTNASDDKPYIASPVSSAFHVRETEEGFHVGVHVTDVSRAVDPGTALDRELQRRGSAVHLCQRVLPLFPPELLKFLSFKKDTESHAISVLLDISHTGRVLKTTIKRTIICPKHTYSINEAASLLEKDERLRLMKTVSLSLRSYFFGTTLPLDRVCRLATRWDEENVFVNARHTNLFEPNNMVVIRDMLVNAANRAVASQLEMHFKKNALLRVQRLPSRENCRLLQRMAIQMGSVLDMSSSKSVLRSLLLIEDPNVRNILQLFYYKVMPRTVYGIRGVMEANIHAAMRGISMMSLNEEPVEEDNALLTHFAAPLERYADIIVHFQLDLMLKNENIPERRLRVWAQASNEAGRRLLVSKFAQESSIHLQLFSKWDANNAWFDGIVCFVSNAYFDVFFPKLGMEKRVHLDLLGLSQVRFDDNQCVLSLQEQNGHWRTVKLLTPVRVRLFALLSTPPLINVKSVSFNV